MKSILMTLALLGSSATATHLRRQREPALVATPAAPTGPSGAVPGPPNPAPTVVTVIAGAPSVDSSPTAVTVTATAGASPASGQSISVPVPPAPPLSTAWQIGGASASAGSLPISTASESGFAPSPTGVGAKCGKGYTYCGFMLQQGGHNFAPEVVNKAYCDGLKDNCIDGVPKTKPDQAVFLCMNDSPASIMLACACSGKCLNEATSNNIAHCDSPCVNGANCF